MSNQNTPDDVAAAQGTIAAVLHQAEATKVLFAELSALAASAREAGAQAKDGAAQVAGTLEAVRTAAGAVAENATRAEALRAQVEQVAQEAAQRSQHIEEGRAYVNAKRTEIDGLLNAAQLSASNAEAQHQAGKALAENVAAANASAQALVATVSASAEAAGASRAAAEKDAAVAAGLAQVAQATEAKVREYETRLEELLVAAKNQQKVIEQLLLGATNAGLASAFDARGKSFKWPQKAWQLVFVGSLAGLLILAGVEAWFSSGVPDWAGLARTLVHRLPFLVPLVWLAVHATWQASLASRMEEEYAFKATISTSFEGYRRQMAEVSKNLTPDSPLARLCDYTLVTISKPPGRIYDKHGKAPTPGSAAAETVAPIMDSASRALGAKTG